MRVARDIDVERALSNIRVSRMADGDLVHHVPCAQDSGLRQAIDASSCVPTHTQTCTCACVK